MNIYMKFTILGLAAFFLSSCNSAYLKDRTNDLADTFTFGVTTGYGVNGQVLFAAGGAGYDGTWIGLENGSPIWRPNKRNWHWNQWINSCPNQYGTILGAKKVFRGTKTDRLRHKNFNIETLFVFLPMAGLNDQTNANYYSKVELSVTPGMGLKIGMNLGEFLDLLIGFSTLDIYDDDIFTKNQKASEESTKQELEPPAVIPSINEIEPVIETEEAEEAESVEINEITPKVPVEENPSVPETEIQ